MKKLNPFIALTAPFSLILLSNLFIAFEAAFEAILLTNLGNLFLAKGTPYYLNKNQTIHQMDYFTN